MRADVGDPVRLALADDQAEQTVAARRRADLFAPLARDPRGDEALDPAEPVDDPQRGVLRPRQVAHPVDDQLEHVVDVEDLGDGTGRRVKRLQPL
jgi:hypothetical protein